MEVIQDVGVKVMKPADMLNLNEPMCPIPEVRLLPRSLILTQQLVTEPELTDRPGQYKVA